MAIQPRKIGTNRFEIPKTGGMRVPGLVFAADEMMAAPDLVQALQQVVNVAHLPGIVNASMAMPDMHWGYGFPIGGVAGFDWDEGVISPGGVGYDINCGVRLARTSLTQADLEKKRETLADALYAGIPTGVGSTGGVRLNQADEKNVLKKGAAWAVEQGMGQASDVEYTEDRGCMGEADPEALTEKALKRGKNQLGTLGSGNHFLEVDVITDIYDPVAAAAFGLEKGLIAVQLHCGSRGLGYQVCDDNIAAMNKQVRKRNIQLPDRQLCWAPPSSGQGQRYFAAMAAAANYAWANRQILLHLTREIFMKTLSVNPRDLQMSLVYDVCHNIAKKEVHRVRGKDRTLCVHRKGATRAFGPNRTEVPAAYRKVGQPVLVPGDMGTCSYVLRGTDTAMAETFGSSCHGAGRVLSRTAAKKSSRGRLIHKELEKKGILVRWTGRTTLMEEMPEAYKDVSLVVDTIHDAGIARKVARLEPLIVIKG